MKTTTVLALDVSSRNTSAVLLAKQACLEIILSSLIHSPNDEFGFVLAGMSDTRNHAHTMDPSRYRCIIVMQEIAKASAEMARAVASVNVSSSSSSSPQQERPVVTGTCDVLETLTVCTQLLHARGANEKYARRICLFTDAKDEVANKSEISEIMESLIAGAVTVTVVGIDFTEARAAVAEEWAKLTIKQGNERVLRYLCETLSEADQTSSVLSVDDALVTARAPRRRHVSLRSQGKLVLTIGDLQVATQWYPRTLTEAAPSLKKLAPDGTLLLQGVRYTRVEAPYPHATADSETHVKPNEATGLPFADSGDEPVRPALRYGDTLVPCTESDLISMKLRGPRGLWAIGCVPRTHVPVYILTGATKTIVPVPGDLSGQCAFACLTEAMLRRHVLLMVRLVGRVDGAPALGVCVPAYEARTDRYYFTYTPLPFTEDVRHYRFPEHEDVQCSSAEESMMDALVADMTVGEDTLQLTKVMNPALHRYYATVQEKLRRAVASEAKDAPTSSSGVTFMADQQQQQPNHHHCSSSEKDTMLNAVPLLRLSSERTAMAFSSPLNELAPLLASVQGRLGAVACAFPYMETDSDIHHNGSCSEQIGGLLARSSLCVSALQTSVVHTPSSGSCTTVAAGVARASSASVLAPSTIAGPVCTSKDEKMPNRAHRSPSCPTVATAVAGHDDFVSSTDPVDSFRRWLDRYSGDPHSRWLAADRLSEVARDLLRANGKGGPSESCEACVVALKAHCLREKKPAYYAAFLQTLREVSQELGVDVTRWEQRWSAKDAAVSPSSVHE